MSGAARPTPFVTLKFIRANGYVQGGNVDGHKISCACGWLECLTGYVDLGSNTDYGENTEVIMWRSDEGYDVFAPQLDTE